MNYSTEIASLKNTVTGKTTDGRPYKTLGARQPSLFLNFNIA
jgi:hypothetical protein